MKLYYRVIHLFFTKQPEHIHYFPIGIYDSKDKAYSAINQLKEKEGFALRPDNFYIIRTIHLRKPKLLNQTYWPDGFTTYKY